MTRRRVVRAGTVAVAALCAAVLVAACGGGSQEASALPPDAPTTSPVDPATAGTVTGRVTFTGTVPTPAALRMDSDPNCVTPGVTPVDDALLVGEGGSLQNAFVYVKDGLGNLRFPIPSQPLVLDQQGCHYTPRIVGIQVGQALEVLNSDQTLHNVHAIPTSNREFNTGQPLAGMKHVHRFSTKEVMVPFKCDVHPWMRAHVGVLDHPFFAVTDASGAFALKGLPPGTYTVEVWHETLGTQTQSVTIGPQETRDVAFSFPS